MTGLERRSETTHSERFDPAAKSAESASESDGVLAQRARAGDRAAFAVLYARFAPSVHGVCLASGPAEEARDLVQDVFLLALRAIDRLEDPDRLGPWLLSIARNRARDALRTRGRSRALAEIDEPRAPVEEPREDEAQSQAVLRAIRSLPESYRETLVLRLVEGLTGPEIAQRTGLTHGSVRVNLHRGMKLLRERLEAAGGN